jgi:Calcineurin-like phosphoesterase
VNPYTLLGVPSDATDEQIRCQRAAKQEANEPNRRRWEHLVPRGSLGVALVGLAGWPLGSHKTRIKAAGSGISPEFGLASCTCASALRLAAYEKHASAAPQVMSSKSPTAAIGGAESLHEHRPPSIVLIVHLSDLHIRALPATNPLSERARAIADAIAAENELQGPALCIIAVTGDIAFSGKQTEYAIAASILREIAAVLRARLKCDVRVDMAPGNHDCDFDREQSVRRSLLQQLGNGYTDASIVTACTSVQAPFFEFAAALAAPWTEPAARLSFDRVRDHSVAILQLNTAWCSSLHEEQGGLVFPIDLIPSCEADLVVATFHHPYAWLRNENARALRERIESTADIVLTGHEHAPGGYRKLNYAGDRNEYIEGGALQDDSDPGHSSFNAIAIDLAKQTQRTFLFKWRPEDALYVNARSGAPREFQRNQSATRKHFQVRDNFRSHLDDPGEAFKHPRKLELQLNEIFVHPQLNAASSDDAIIPSLLSHVLKKRRLLICGAALSGKTALAKYLFEALRREGVVPVVVSGEKLSPATRDDPDCLRTSAFLHCYEPAGLERFRQLDASQRALIIDDVQTSTLATDLLEGAIRRLESAFSFVVVLCSEDFPMALVESLRSSSRESLLEYDRLNIQPLGHRLRYDLVEKWCSIGRLASEDLSEISSRALRLDRMVTAAISTNLLPASPAFVLLCLQQLDGPDNRATMGSFGHLYESLITQNLNSGGAPRPAIDVDAKRRFLSHFAYELFTSKREDLSDGEWDAAFTQYTARYDVTFPRSTFLAEILATRLVEQSDDRVAFRYPYAFCFFVAEYMQNNLADPSVLAAARELCERLHHETSANIFLFLSHLSRNTVVLDLLLQRARSFFLN